ncbi:nitroreductase [Rhizorhabdus argentea]|uniref:nitroreductase n=1 Tax=Rhizorhabdus argentea TaxID=1387174 RepID=UPI0030EB42EB
MTSPYSSAAPTADGDIAEISFRDVVKTRRSVRQFLTKTVPHALITAVLEDAQQAPSNCNSQPWQVHILSGAVRDKFSQECLAAEAEGRPTLDFSFDTADFSPLMAERAAAQGRAYYEALGVTRDDFDARRTAILRNLALFDAPHVALLFMPPVGDNVRAAGDIGMYAQTFLLSLVAHGLAGVPQTYLGYFAQVARQVLGLDDDLKLLFGISFGYADTGHAAAQYRIAREPISRSVQFHY